jgi:leucine-rich PPR motif-containing protein
MIDAHLKEGDHVKTLKLVDDMLKKGGNVSKNVCHVLIDPLCRKEHVSEVLKVLEKIEEQGLNLSLATCSTLVRCFHKAGKMDGAARVLKSMVRFKWVPDSTELNDLINVEQDSTDSENAGDFLKQMAWEVACQVRA